MNEIVVTVEPGAEITAVLTPDELAIFQSRSAAEASALAAGTSATASQASAVESGQSATTSSLNAGLVAADLLTVQGLLTQTNQDAIETALDLVATNQDTVNTAADLAATNADVVLTNADVQTTNADATQTALDKLSASNDAAQTALDRIATGQDKLATAADLVLTNADVVSTNADVVSTNVNAAATASNLADTNQNSIDTASDLASTNQDAINTAADATQTALDRTSTSVDATQTALDAVASAQDALDTGADRVQTGLDRVATNEDRTATGNHLTATNQDTIDTAADVVLTNADVATTNNTRLAVEAIFDNFDDRYLGAKTADPSVDNDGEALTSGQVYWNSVNTELKFYNGAVWEAPSAQAATSATNALASANAAAASEIQTGLDEAATAQDKIDTAADAISTGQDAANTASDLTNTNANVVLTNADAAATSNDVATTNANAVSTGNDAIATAADAVNTSADATTASNAKSAAEAALASFDDVYLGAKTSDPTVDNDGDALVGGALYYYENADPTLNLMKVYNGAAWVAAYASAGGALNASNNLGDVANAATSAANLGLEIGTDVQAYSSVLAATEASFLTVDKTKLDGVSAGAEVNPGLISQADAEAGTATVEKTYSALRIAQAIAALSPPMSDADVKTAYENNAETNAFTDAEQTKLASLDSGAQVNDSTTLVDADIGVNVQAYDAVLTATTASFLTADRTKLDGVAPLAEVNPALISQAEAETGTDTAEKTVSALRMAQAIVALAPNMSDADIKTAYENNSDTNEFSDTEKTKLSGIATGAEVNDATALLDADIGVNVQAYNATLTGTDATFTTGLKSNYDTAFGWGNHSGLYQPTDNPIFTGVVTVNSTEAIIVPVGTTGQRPTAVKGQFRFNDTDATFEGYDGTEWGPVGGSTDFVYVATPVVATASQTVFTAAYTVGYVQFWLNGVKLVAGTDFTATNGTSITLTSGAPAGANVEIVAFTTFAVANTLVAANIGATILPVNNPIFTGTLTGNSTEAIKIPIGSTAQRPTGAAAMLRFNTDEIVFEGFNGSEWGAIGGGGNGSIDGGSPDSIYANNQSFDGGAP